jgi:inorganic pyrophosphatase
MLEMEDEEGIDTKVLAVPDKKVDPIFGLWESIDDVPKHILDVIEHFFNHYKELEPGKIVKTHGFKARAVAEKEVEASFVEECEDCGCSCDDCKEGCDCGCECKSCEDCDCEHEEKKKK